MAQVEPHFIDEFGGIPKGLNLPADVKELRKLLLMFREIKGAAHGGFKVAQPHLVNRAQLVIVRGHGTEAQNDFGAVIEADHLFVRTKPMARAARQMRCSPKDFPFSLKKA